MAWVTLVGEGVLCEMIRVNIERHDLLDECRQLLTLYELGIRGNVRE